MGEKEEWGKTQDTLDKMRPEDVQGGPPGVEVSKRPGVEGTKPAPGYKPSGGGGGGGVFSQLRNLPFSPTNMAIGGLVFVGVIVYLAFCPKKKPEFCRGNVARVREGVSDPPRK